MSEPITTKTFPDGFWWGVATAGHQIEGGNVHSNWWAWEQLGLVDDGTTSGRACDYWNRYAEDHQLLVDLGQQGLRLGIEWARLEPTEGSFDDEALEHYVAIVGDLRAKGLQVCLTLNHWVLPNWLAELGGWLSERAHEGEAHSRFAISVAVTVTLPSTFADAAEIHRRPH